jgi:Glycogen recognition site of AMP-activated protein kinase
VLTRTTRLLLAPRRFVVKRSTPSHYDTKTVLCLNLSRDVQEQAVEFQKGLSGRQGFNLTNHPTTCLVIAMHRLDYDFYYYKCIVDDEWRCAPDQSTVTDIEARIKNSIGVTDVRLYTGDREFEMNKRIPNRYMSGQRFHLQVTPIFWG